MDYVKEITIPIDRPYNKAAVFAKQGDANSRFFLVRLTKCDRPITPEEIGDVSLVAIGVRRSYDNKRKCFAGEYNGDGTFFLPLPHFATEIADDDVYCDIMVFSSGEASPCGCPKGESKDSVIRSAAVVVHIEPAS